MVERYHTSLTESKELMRLGLDYETAGMSWLVDDHGEHVRVIPYIECEEVLEGLEDWERMATTYYPAWTISDLIQMLPDMFQDETDRISKLELTKRSVSYVYLSGGQLKMGFEGELLQSIYKMICWLNENGYIKSIKK